MDFYLAVAISCTDTSCQVQLLESEFLIDAQRSEPMVEHGIWVRPGQLVVVDKGAEHPQIVYRWQSMEAKHTESGFTLIEGEEPVDLNRLRAEHFPRIQAMYRRMEAAKAIDPKQVVRQGYDRIAERYLAWVQAERSETRMRYTKALLDALPPGAQVLDLGCGAGGPTMCALGERFDVTGVDISARSVALARQNVPQARFMQADMTEVNFAPRSFDAVAAFYSFIHVPRQEQPALLHKIASWLRPGGLLVATMGTHSIKVDYAEDFLGAPMYWSTFDGETNRRMVEEAGLQIVRAQQETEEEHGQPVTFFWIIARKPTPRATAGA